MNIPLPKKIDGYKLDAEYRIPRAGDECLDADGLVFIATAYYGHRLLLVLTPERKVLDWSKVDKWVLCYSDEFQGLYPKGMCVSPSKIFNNWQAHTLGDKCPVDSDACVVDVKNWDGCEYSAVASDINWSAVAQFRVTELSDGYEYE